MIGARAGRHGGRCPWASASALALALAIALVAATAGCRNLFLPSEPEPPAADGAAISVDIDFTNAEGVLATLSMAVWAKNRGNGFRAYMAAFADTTTQGLGLRIDLDPDVVRERDEATVPHPAVWLREHEAGFYLYLSTLNSGEYDLIFTNDGDVYDAPDHATLYRTYVLTATDSEGTATQLATGKAEIEFRRLPGASSNWVITRWTDSILSPEIGPSPPPDAGLYCFSRIRIDGYNH